MNATPSNSAPGLFRVYRWIDTDFLAGKGELTRSGTMSSRAANRELYRLGQKGDGAGLWIEEA